MHPGSEIIAQGLECCAFVPARWASTQMAEQQTDTMIKTRALNVVLFKVKSCHTFHVGNQVNATLRRLDRSESEAMIRENPRKKPHAFRDCSINTE